MVQKTLDTKNGFESCLIVSKSDATLGSLTKFTANEEFSLILNEDGVKTSDIKLYCELIKTYGAVLFVNELNWKGESVSAKLVLSVTLFLKLTTK